MLAKSYRRAGHWATVVSPKADGPCRDLASKAASRALAATMQVKQKALTVILVGMFSLPEPTSLETVVAQAANDLKVSGFGQRIRAALRRNLAAQDKTALPDHIYRDVPGPDLVRQFNALLLLALTHSAENPQGKQAHDVDRELFSALQSSLDIARQMVAYMWVGPLSNVAPAFADHDDLPPPFCPMYPNARDLVASGETALPHQLTEIINRVKAEVEQTPTWTRAVQCAAELELEEVQTLHAAKKRFQEQAGGVQGETLNQWQERIHGLLVEAKSDVPKALLLVNRLVTASVAAMVSLTVWDHLIRQEDVLKCVPRSFGEDLPNGFDISIAHLNHVAILALDSSFRLENQGTFTGIGTTKGTRLSWGRGQELNVSLSVIRLSAYESPNDNLTST
ncbi:MAG: hypothetical protein OXQ32_08590 [bacterium]|nr:hypothetical protein [bacterium]